MRLKEAIDNSDFRSPVYNAGDGIQELIDVAKDSKDKKLISLVQKVNSAMTSVHEYLDKKYKGWD